MRLASLIFFFFFFLRITRTDMRHTQTQSLLLYTFLRQFLLQAIYVMVMTMQHSLSAASIHTQPSFDKHDIITLHSIPLLTTKSEGCERIVKKTCKLRFTDCFHWRIQHQVLVFIRQSIAKGL
jgi:hypothetical protein